MSKKVIVMIVTIFSILSIILIAVWGSLPENPSNIDATIIQISVYDELNNDGDKLKDITNIVTAQNNIYTINYTVEPGNALTIITASSTSDLVSLQIDQDNHLIYVIYDLQAINSKATITIQIKDKNTQLFDEITLWYKNPDIIIVPEI